MGKKYFLGWTNIKKMILEIIKTWSNEPSWLSSKRIERSIFTGTTIGIVVATAIYLIKSGKMDATSAIVLVTPLLLAAGYNTAMGYKDKKSTDEVK